MKTEDLRKRFIVDVVRHWAKMYPLEYQEAKDVARNTKASRANVFGADAAGEMRLRLRLPKRLYKALDQALDEPHFLHEDAELKWFLQTFPEFQVADKAL